MACVVAGLHLGLVLTRLFAEARRSRTLIALVKLSPAGTIVEMCSTPELPATKLCVGGPHDTPNP